MGLVPSVKFEEETFTMQIKQVHKIQIVISPQTLHFKTSLRQSH